MKLGRPIQRRVRSRQGRPRRRTDRVQRQRRGEAPSGLPQAAPRCGNAAYMYVFIGVPQASILRQGLGKPCARSRRAALWSPDPDHRLFLGGRTWDDARGTCRAARASARGPDAHGAGPTPGHGNRRLPSPSTACRKRWSGPAGAVPHRGELQTARTSRGRQPARACSGEHDHELRTPHNGLLGISSSQGGGEQGANWTTLTGHALSSGLPVDGPPRDLQDLSRIESGPKRIEHRPFHPVPVCSQPWPRPSPPCTTQARPLLNDSAADSRHCMLETKTRPQICSIWWNAMKFTDRAKVRLEISAAVPLPQASTAAVHCRRQPHRQFDESSTDLPALHPASE
jgi:hypothetical protein